MTTERTYGGTLEVGIAQDDGTGRWLVILTMRPSVTLPAGRAMGAHYPPGEISELLNALGVAALRADERNAELELEASTSTGEGL